MAAFKKGDDVKVKAIVPEGPVESMRMDEDGNVQYLISWVGSDNETHSRWFNEDELTAA